MNRSSPKGKPEPRARSLALQDISGLVEPVAPGHLPLPHLRDYPGVEVVGVVAARGYGGRGVADVLDDQLAEEGA